MKVFLIVMAIAGCVGPVAAQTLPYQGSSAQLEAESRAADNLSARKFETPTMRLQKIQRAEALRTEVLKLQSEDGGVLSNEHALYVRKESAKIINYTTSTPPGIVPLP